jgi:hypothetical protein
MVVCQKMTVAFPSSGDKGVARGDAAMAATAAGAALDCLSPTFRHP